MSRRCSRSPCANVNPNEGRLYALRLLTNSNPYGAVVKVGGVPLSNGLEYFIDADQSQQATLTVERGPTRYDYNDLALVLYPPCEYDGWRRRGAAPAGRHAVGLASASPLLAAMSRCCCRRAVGSTTRPTRMPRRRSICCSRTTSSRSATTADRSIDVGAEYRRLGVGQEGPGAVDGIPVVSSPDPDETFIQWHPPDSLEDGVYELRAYTHCAERHTGYSEVSTGTIERTARWCSGRRSPPTASSRSVRRSASRSTS